MHLMRVVNGKMLQVHLCATCAAEFGLKPPEALGIEPGDLLDTLKKLDALGRDLRRNRLEIRDNGQVEPEEGEESDEGIEEAGRQLFEELARTLRMAAGEGGEGEDEPDGTGEGMAGELPEGAAGKRCRTCGTRLEDMMSTLTATCPDCYELMGPVLEKERLLKAHPHGGKVPSGADADTRRQAAMVRKWGEMVAATCAERYEDAARLRDEVATLQDLQAEEAEKLFAEGEASAASAAARKVLARPASSSESGVVWVRLCLRRNLADRPFQLEPTLKTRFAILKAVGLVEPQTPEVLRRVAEDRARQRYFEPAKSSAVRRMLEWRECGNRPVPPQEGAAGPVVWASALEGGHLCLYAEGTAEEAESMWSALSAADAACERAGAHWAFDPRLGYLARDLSRCGTGLDVQVLLHLPALHELGRIQAANAALGGLGLVLEPLASVDDGPEDAAKTLPYFWLGVLPQGLPGPQNPWDYGRDELTLLADILAVARALAHQDYEALQRVDAVWAADRYLRAAAAFSTARRMGQYEALALLSDLRMGEELGISPKPVRIAPDAVLDPARFWRRLRETEPAFLAARWLADHPTRELLRGGLDNFSKENIREIVFRARADSFSDLFPKGVRPAPAGQPKRRTARSAPKSKSASGRTPPPSPRRRHHPKPKDQDDE